MAKSKNGGSRAFIRGRIGSDVYSVGKDGQGKRQQVVRSLAVQVTNPRTSAQMANRMIMSTVMQAVSAFAPIIDHSFDGLAKGQPSISEFIRRNYALAKAQFLAGNDDQSHGFLYNRYQEKGFLPGSYIISNGSVEPLASSGVDVVLTSGFGGGVAVSRVLSKLDEGASFKMSDLISVWPVGIEDYITMVFIGNDIEQYGGVAYNRVRLNKSLSSDTVLTAANISNAFVIEGNVPSRIVFTAPTASENGNVYIQCVSDESMDIQGSVGENAGAIVSKMVSGQWEHSTLQFNITPDEYTGYRSIDDALSSYPVGTEQFLNGGDL